MTSSLGPDALRHVPGYSGFVPGTKSQVGATYGTATAVAVEGDERLSRPLRRSVEGSPETQAETRGVVADPARARALPGYTGHVRRLHGVVGRTYGLGSRISEVLDKEDKEAKDVPWESHHKPGDTVPVVKNVLFEPGAKDIKPRSELDDRHKPVGFSGFIPGSQNHFGRSYGNMTRKSKELGLKMTMVGDPSEFDEHKTKVPEKPAAFSPGYTGFIPHAKDDMGTTYGNITKRYVAKGREEQAHNVVWSTPRGTTSSSVSAQKKSLADDAPRDEYYRIPGYTGYVSGNQEHFGQTYGQVTREVRSNMARHSSARARLSQPGTGIDSPNTTENKLPPATANRTPPALGYSGHVPHSKFAFGQSFGKTAVDAKFSSAPQPPVARPNQPRSVVHRKQPRSDELSHLQQQLSSGKVPGWSGYIPHSQEHWGKSYGEITRRVKENPFNYSARSDATVEGQPRGKIPGYTGWTAGSQFEFGKTYGRVVHTKP